MLNRMALAGFGGRAAGGSRYWRMRIVDGDLVSGTQYASFPISSIEFKSDSGGPNLSGDPVRASSNFPYDPVDGTDFTMVFDGDATFPGDPAGYEQRTFHKHDGEGGRNIFSFPTASQFIGIWYAYDFGVAKNIRAMTLAASIFPTNLTVTLAVEKSADGTTWQTVHEFTVNNAAFDEPWYAGGAAEGDYPVNAHTVTW